MSLLSIALYVSGMLALALLLNIGGWWAAVRALDSLGRRLRFHQFVAVRHLRGRKSGFLTAISMLSILGVSFSSCTLTTVLSVMGGFSDDLKNKILNTNAHVVVDNYGTDLGARSGEDGTSWKEVLASVRGVEGVLAATPVVQSEVMMNARTNNHGIELKGIDPESFVRVSEVLHQLDEGEVEYIEHPRKLFDKVRHRRARFYGKGADGGPDPPADAGPDPPPDAGTAADGGAPDTSGFIPPPSSPRQRVLPCVIVGRELAQSLRLYMGEEVNIVSPLGDIGPTGPIPRSRPFRVGGVFFSGMYEFDNLYVYTSIEAAQRFLNKGESISEIHVAVQDPEKAGAVASRISGALGDGLRVRAWQELNASLFSALKLEKIVMFIFLSLAILVASFCIIATLSMLVIEKESEISVLMTLGASSKGVMQIFRFEGLLIGLVGTTSGLLVGLTLSLSLKHFGFEIDPEVWYINKLPVEVSFLEFLFVGLAALAITQIATLFATLVASKPHPVEGLKNG